LCLVGVVPPPVGVGVLERMPFPYGFRPLFCFWDIGYQQKIFQFFPALASREEQHAR